MARTSGANSRESVLIRPTTPRRTAFDSTVLPGAHETPRIEELIEQAVERGDVADYEEGYAEWADGIPLERIGDPQELGDAVAFLASDRASYVNGASLPVDGGSLRS